VTAPERTPVAPRSISATLASAARPESKATIAPSPACIDRVGTSHAGFADAATACSAARMTFLLFGSTTASLAPKASIAAAISAVDGFMDSPPSTHAAPMLSNSLRFPSPAQTATTPHAATSAVRTRSSRSAV
jgi:hypothetical protein